MTHALKALDAQREAVAAAMRRIYSLRLTTTTGGNISLRLPDSPSLPGGGCVITPSGGDKSATTAAEIAVLDAAGTALTRQARPSSEFPMHLAIYRRCPRVGAIVHAHPPTASAFTATDEPILTDLTSEAFAILRHVVVVPYALTASERLAELVADAARGANCLLLENHGVVTLGTTLEEATSRLEVLESAAWQTWLLKTMGGGRRLSAEQIRELEKHYGPFVGDA
jgi:L-fuculose-phosphate aldolase